MINDSKPENVFDNKKVLILGFGREGVSTYRFIRRHFPALPIGIADYRKSAGDEFLKDYPCDPYVEIHTGDNYLESLHSYDLVIKSPGISYKVFSGIEKVPAITSQTELFIKFFRQNIIGVTGSKGKSTTASMIYHILSKAKNDVVFVGNIGIPPFDRIEAVKDNSLIVYELSSHQLEQTGLSPHIGILLNIFPEHLDHYLSYEDYQEAKFNIARYQENDDKFIFNAENQLILDLIKKYPLKSEMLAFGDKPKGEKNCFLSGNDIVFSDGKVFKNVDKKCKLTGRHNLYNIMAAIFACRIAGVDDGDIIKGISTFSGLPHRLEYIGRYGGVDYYNDSIATIPEAAIEAINSIPALATIILGGYDRGVNYSGLVECLKNSSIDNFVLIGNAGKRIYGLMLHNCEQLAGNAHLVESFDEAVKLGIELTPSDMSCLLSPAAASYDMFRDFEERGERFRKLVIVYNK